MSARNRILPIVILALAGATPLFGQLLGLGAAADTSSRVQALTSPGAPLGAGIAQDGRFSSGAASAQWGTGFGAAVRDGPGLPPSALGARGSVESGFGASARVDARGSARGRGRGRF